MRPRSSESDFPVGSIEACLLEEVRALRTSYHSQRALISELAKKIFELENTIRLLKLESEEGK